MLFSIRLVSGVSDIRILAQPEQVSTSTTIRRDTIRRHHDVAVFVQCLRRTVFNGYDFGNPLALFACMINTLLVCFR